MTRRISKEEFAALTAPLVGMRVSRAQKGYGSSLVLELGDLHGERIKLLRGKAVTRQKGEEGIRVLWSWRIERVRSIDAGSWSTDQRFERAIRELRGRRILALTVEGRLPELVVTFSGGRWLHSLEFIPINPQMPIKPSESSITVKVP